MILGIGTDLVDIRRIERALARHGGRFEARLFTPQEIARARSRPSPSAAYARRFALKEAAAKALGTGFRDGLTLRDIEVTNDALGRPQVHWHGKAAGQLTRLTPPGMRVVSHASVSDEHPYASALVIIEALPL